MIERTERLAELLQDAILIAESSRDNAVLAHLRVARLSLRENTFATAPIRVDLLSGRVFNGGLPVALSPSELALVLALAINQRGTPREILAEDLYPDSDPTCAQNAVKVSVHRVRRRFGMRESVRYEGGRYFLGDAVDVELPRLEAFLRELRLQKHLSGEDRDRLEQIRQRVLDGRPGFILDWQWFDETERRLREFGRDLTGALADAALRAGRYQRALELAAELAAGDRLDESAAEIAIRAYLLAGNRTAAVLEYRRFRSTLRSEGEVPPSDDLRALIDDQRIQSSSQRTHP